MNNQRKIALVLIGIGFAITALVGFFLAAGDVSSDRLIVPALIAFVVVVPIIGLGVYQYSKSDMESNAVSEMEQQRRMMDIIRQRGQVSLEELAAELRVSIGTVTRLVEDLDSLDLFTGYIDWANSRIYAVQPQELPESNA
jgi:hypothetical protein